MSTFVKNVWITVNDKDTVDFGGDIGHISGPFIVKWFDCDRYDIVTLMTEMREWAEESNTKLTFLFCLGDCLLVNFKTPADEVHFRLRF